MKKNLLLVFIVAIIILLAYGCFFRFHLVSDAYRIIDSSTEFIINLKCNEGRLFQVLYFSILDMLNISINSINIYMYIYRINLLISILILIICVILTFKMLTANIQNITKQNKIVVFICTLLIFINVSVSEYMLYFENAIMVFGLLCAVTATYVYHKNIKFKYFLIMMLLLISSFCYQGVTQSFVMLSALLLFLRNPNGKQKYYIKELLRIILLYLFSLFMNYLVCWWLNSILPNIDPRVFTGIKESLSQLISNENILLLIIYILVVFFIVICNCDLFRNEKSKEALLNIPYMIILSIISFEIFYFNNRVGLLIRTILNVIITYPVLIIYIVNVKDNKEHIIDIILPVIILIFNILMLINFQFASIDSTTKNINVVTSIVREIAEYETENNVKIDNIAFYCDKNLSAQYWDVKNVLYNTYTIPVYYGYWCDIYSINVLSGKKYNRISDFEVDIEIRDYFNTKDWNEPNIEEQVIFKDNTAHICCF